VFLSEVAIKKVGKRAVLAILGIVGVAFVVGVVKMLFKAVSLAFDKYEYGSGDAASTKGYDISGGDEAPTVAPFTVVPPSYDERRRLFTSYILSRFDRTALESDPAFPYMEELAVYLSVPFEIRTAKIELNKVFPAPLAKAVEQLVTGDVWTEAMDGPAVR